MGAKVQLKPECKVYTKSPGEMGGEDDLRSWITLRLGLNRRLLNQR